jgi:hypothetical protein
MLTGDWWKDNPDIPLQGFPDPLGLRGTGTPDSILQFMMRLQYNFG